MFRFPRPRSSQLTTSAPSELTDDDTLWNFGASAQAAVADRARTVATAATIAEPLFISRIWHLLHEIGSRPPARIPPFIGRRSLFQSPRDAGALHRVHPVSRPSLGEEIRYR